MSECDCTTEAVCEEGEKRACSCGGTFFKFLPYVLLIAAAILWYWDTQKKKERAVVERERFEAVKTVVEKVTVPLKAVAIGQKIEGRDAIAALLCPPPMATNLLTQIARAKPADFPEDAEGTECEIQLVQTNDMVTVLQAVVLDKDPEALYVGVKYPGKRDEAGKIVSWVITPPVRAEGAGVLVNEILNAVHNLTPTLLLKADEAKNAQPQPEAETEE